MSIRCIVRRWWSRPQRQLFLHSIRPVQDILDDQLISATAGHAAFVCKITVKRWHNRYEISRTDVSRCLCLYKLFRNQRRSAMFAVPRTTGLVYNVYKILKTLQTLEYWPTLIVAGYKRRIHTSSNAIKWNLLSLHAVLNLLHDQQLICFPLHYALF